VLAPEPGATLCQPDSLRLQRRPEVSLFRHHPVHAQVCQPVKRFEVAVLVDNRSNKVSDFRWAMAATGNRQGDEVGPGERESLLALYLAKHPHLKDFVQSPTCAFCEIKVQTFLWSPASARCGGSRQTMKLALSLLKSPKRTEPGSVAKASPWPWGGGLGGSPYAKRNGLRVPRRSA